MLHSTVTSKGQTTLPSQVRQALDLKPGDRLTYEVAADHVTIRVHPGTRSLRGSLPSAKGKGKSFAAVRSAAARAWARRQAARGGAAHA